MYFRNYGLAKTRLDKYLKSAASHYPSRSNMVNVLQHCSLLYGGTFTIFWITSKEIESEKVTFSDTENVKILC